jgi:hypothetical protein
MFAVFGVVVSAVGSELTHVPLTRLRQTARLWRARPPRSSGPLPAEASQDSRRGEGTPPGLAFSSSSSGLRRRLLAFAREHFATNPRDCFLG